MHKNTGSWPISLAGRLAYYCIPYRRKVVLENIQQVYGDSLNLAEQKDLAKAFYSHAMLCLKEGFLMRLMSEKRLREKVSVEGEDYLFEIAKGNKGLLILTGHFGNWEFAPIGGILNFKAFQGQFHFIRRTLNFKFIERWLFRRYYRSGLGVIPKKNSLTQVVDALEQNHAVVFVMDQHASLVNRDGIAVEFFGKKAGTYRSLATLARHTGVPVIPAASYRKPDGQHVLAFYPPIHWEDKENATEGLHHNTRRYNQALETMILAHPEQWSWFHKRWKLKPED